MIAFRHILVPTDFGPAARRALDIALELAAKLDAKVTVLHATWLPPYHYSVYAEGLAWPTDELEIAARRELDDALTDAKARCLRLEGMLVAGVAWEKILETIKTRHVDMVVMGTHGRRGLSRLLLGSVAEKVVRLSPVPVLTVPGEEEQEAIMNDQTTATRAIARILNTCIEACTNGEKGYAVAAADVRDPVLKALFHDYSEQRAEFVRGLQIAVQELGAFPENRGTAGGTAHRGFMAVRRAVEGRATRSSSANASEASARHSLRTITCSPKRLSHFRRIRVACSSISEHRLSSPTPTCSGDSLLDHHSYSNPARRASSSSMSSCSAPSTSRRMLRRVA